MQNQGQNWQKTGSCVPNVGLSGNPSNLSYRGGDRSQAVPRGTGKEKKHNKTQKLNREHLFSPDRGPVQPCGGPAWFQEPPKSSISQGQLPDALGPHRVLVETSSCPREYHACTLQGALQSTSTHRSPGEAPRGSDSPVPTLAATAGQHVFSRHLHVDTPIAVDADPVRNGFHSPERLQEQAPQGEPHSALRSLQPTPRRPQLTPWAFLVACFPQGSWGSWG